LNLVYVPIEFLKKYYSLIVKQIKVYDNKNIQLFLSYFENTYLMPYNKNNNKETFSPYFWNACQRILAGIPTTTNSLEGWHRSLNMKSYVPHLNLLKFINVLQKEESFSRIKYTRLLNGVDKIVINGGDKKYQMIMIVLNCCVYNELVYLQIVDGIVDWKLGE
jgi:hypothetical protein